MKMESKYMFYVFSVKIICLFHFVIMIDLFWVQYPTTGSNSCAPSSFCCCCIKLCKTVLPPTPPPPMAVKVISRFSVLDTAALEQTGLVKSPVHESVVSRCWDAEKWVWAFFTWRRLALLDFEFEAFCAGSSKEAGIGFQQGHGIGYTDIYSVLRPVCSASVSWAPLECQGPGRH